MEKNSHLRAIAGRLAKALLFVLPFIPSANATTSAAGAGDEWKYPLGTAQGTSYSTLNRIKNTDFSSKWLVLEKKIATGIKRGHQGAPLVVNVGTVASPVRRLFVVTPWPNQLKSYDLAGNLKWTYSPGTSKYAIGQACCDAVNRGAVYDSVNKRVIYATLDGKLVSVNASTGKQVWKIALADVRKGETITVAPIIAGNYVVVGNAGAEMGVRGWLKGVPLSGSTTGRWTAYNTGPDTDVKIDPSRNYYAKDNSTNGGSDSWTGEGTSPTYTTDRWKQGGSTVWGWISYDPELNLVFYGTANPGVWNPEMRPGANKWSASIIARNPSTGQAAWIYQLTPHDEWDYDAMNEVIVISDSSSPSGKALFHFNKNGFAYKLDAATGQVLSANKFVNATWARSINTTTGLPEIDDVTGVTDPAALQAAFNRTVKEKKTTEDICPSPAGGKEFSPAAYSPRTGWLYVPALNMCSSFQPLRSNYYAGTPFMGHDLGGGADFPRQANSNAVVPGSSPLALGQLVAWDPVNGRRQWAKDEGVLWGGVLATAGDIVAYGTLDRKLKVRDAVSGDLLQEVSLECPSVGNPITFTGNDGEQRIAIYSGVGWLAGLYSDAGMGGCPYVGDDDYIPPPGSPTSGSLYIFKLQSR